MDAKLAKTYYSPGGYWKGLAAIKKLAEAAKVPEDAAKKWLAKQALWQIYLFPPQHVPRPKFDVPTPNKVHQADLLFLPHDKLPRGRKVFKYALTVAHVASRYKEVEPLTSKNSDEVVQTFQKIYRRSPLTWPEMLQVDPGREFMGAVSKEIGKTQNLHSTRATRASPQPGHKVGRTKDLTKRLTHRAYKTCFDGPFKYVLTVETSDADTAGGIENFFLQKHSDRRLLRPNGSKCELMKMTFQAILESEKIILSQHFPGL